MAFITSAPSSTDSYSFFKTSYFFTKMQLLIIVTFNSFTFSFESVTFMSLKIKIQSKLILVLPYIPVKITYFTVELQEKRVQYRRDAEQERCWTGGIQDRWDAGQEGCRTGRTQEKEGCSCTDEISISDVNSHKNFSREYLYVPKNVLL